MFLGSQALRTDFPYTTFAVTSPVGIENNECEQLIKHGATGRKRWLFLGSFGAEYNSEILTTIEVTAHGYNLDVYSCVKGVPI
jgi:hypothetical protein